MNISIGAQDKKQGMTASELQAALSMASPNGSARIKASTSWRGYLTSVEFVDGDERE